MDETNENNETTIVHNYENGSEIKQESDSNEQQEDGNHHSLPTVDGIMADVGVSANSASKSSRWAERLSTAAGVAGNMMEWYDFAVFGYFSDIIGDIFFPPDQEGNAALVESFLVFGTGFLMRPLGGALLGYIGDKYGRKLSLEHSIFIMALSTFLLGCLPTYDQIGYASTVLLVIVRMLQGLSVGGQLMTSLVFTLERKPKKFWGYYGAVVMSTATVGTLFGGIIAYIVRENLNDDDLHSWGWRIPFLLGCLVVIPGWYLKYKTTDNREHLDDNVPVENPIKELMNPVYARSLISCSMMVTAGAGGFYLAYVWMVIFMETIMEPPVDNAFAINSVSLFIGAICIYPYCGHLSDSIGRLPMMITGGILLIFLGPISVILVNVGDPFAAFLGQSFLGLSLSIFGAPTNAWIVENFPPQVRLTALSVAYNLTTGIIGGFTPALATVLVDYVGKVSPGFLMSVYSIISLIGLYISPRVEISMKSKAKTSSSSPNDEKVPDNEVV